MKRIKMSLGMKLKQMDLSCLFWIYLYGWIKGVCVCMIERYAPACVGVTVTHPPVEVTVVTKILPSSVERSGSGELSLLFHFFSPRGG